MGVSLDVAENSLETMRKQSDEHAETVTSLEARALELEGKSDEDEPSKQGSIEQLLSSTKTVSELITQLMLQLDGVQVRTLHNSSCAAHGTA
mmetsp:Transcript_17419/g.37819  ORF Transcript_17419/g.37819 Transcript_17419/m.37819 type:complete len:92 (+) Transcript_17419:169-444(+)